MLKTAFLSCCKKITTVMGSILSLFKKKKSSLEELQEIDETAKAIDEYNKNVERRYKTVVSILFYSGVLLVLLGFLYVYLVPLRGFRAKCIYGGILLALSLILIFLRRIMSWYYHRKISTNRKKLNELEVTKKKIIKDVMEKETYNVAKEILEKYAPSTVFPSRPMTTLAPVARGQTAPNVRQRSVLPPPTSALLQAANQLAPNRQLQVRVPTGGRPASGGTSVLDRMAEFLLGDGAPSRYALICIRCHAHNGLALPEEFPYLSFRCLHCNEMNPARKQRPSAPRLETSSETANPSRPSEISDVPKASDTTQSVEAAPSSEGVESLTEKLSQNEVANSGFSDEYTESDVPASEAESSNEEGESQVLSRHTDVRPTVQAT